MIALVAPAAGEIPGGIGGGVQPGATLWPSPDSIDLNQWRQSRVLLLDLAVAPQDLRVSLLIGRLFGRSVFQFLDVDLI